jgi:hypothetical protein
MSAPPGGEKCLPFPTAFAISLERFVADDLFLTEKKSFTSYIF